MHAVVAASRGHGAAAPNFIFCAEAETLIFAISLSGREVDSLAASERADRNIILVGRPTAARPSLGEILLFWELRCLEIFICKVTAGAAGTQWIAVDDDRAIHRGFAGRRDSHRHLRREPEHQELELPRHHFFSPACVASFVTVDDPHAGPVSPAVLGCAGEREEQDDGATHTPWSATFVYFRYVKREDLAKIYLVIWNTTSCMSDKALKFPGSFNSPGLQQVESKVFPPEPKSQTKVPEFGFPMKPTTGTPERT